LTAGHASRSPFNARQTLMRDTPKAAAISAGPSLPVQLAHFFDGHRGLSAFVDALLWPMAAA
jgi:hypothetical protein